MGRVYVDVDKLIAIHYSTFLHIREVAGKDADSAFALYFRYLIQARMQRDNTTISTNSFMMRAMDWGEAKLLKCKKILEEAGLIRTVSVEDASKAGGYRVEIVTSFEADGGYLENDPPPQNTPPGKTGVQNNNNIITSNNISNNKKEKDKGKAELSRRIVKLVLDYLIGKGYSYTRETPVMAFHLSGNGDFLKAADEAGGVDNLVTSIMDYSESDNFWKGKIDGVNSFGRKWATLHNQMRAKGIAVKKKVQAEDAAAFISLIENA